MTYVEVVDTAVKVGLGALISAVASYLVARHNSKKDIDHLTLTRRIDGVEKITEQAEEHFAAWRRFCAIMKGIYSGRNRPNPSFSESQMELLRKYDTDYSNTRDSMGHAVARLRLLGLTNAANLINEHSRTFALLRNRILLQHETPSEEEISECVQTGTDIVRNFYSEMSSYYLGLSKP